MADSNQDQKEEEGIVVGKASHQNGTGNDTPFLKEDDVVSSPPANQRDLDPKTLKIFEKSSSNDQMEEKENHQPQPDLKENGGQSAPTLQMASPNSKEAPTGRRPKSHRKKLLKIQKKNQYLQQVVVTGQYQQGSTAANFIANGEWNDRFQITASTHNRVMHPFYREYFDKKPKQLSTNFRVKYANSTNEIPGITDAGTRQHTQTKFFRDVPEKPHLNVKKVMNETRVPFKKGQSKVSFNGAKKHFKMANGWTNDFAVMSSRANNQMYKDKREFFDKPIVY